MQHALLDQCGHRAIHRRQIWSGGIRSSVGGDDALMNLGHRQVTIDRFQDCQDSDSGRHPAQSAGTQQFADALSVMRRDRHPTSVTPADAQDQPTARAVLRIACKKPSR
jgi:hypothetical protein